MSGVPPIRPIDPSDFDPKRRRTPDLPKKPVQPANESPEVLIEQERLRKALLQALMKKRQEAGDPGGEFDAHG